MVNGQIIRGKMKSEFHTPQGPETLKKLAETTWLNTSITTWFKYPV
jgi:hypothetical protein